MGCFTLYPRSPKGLEGSMGSLEKALISQSTSGRIVLGFYANY